MITGTVTSVYGKDINTDDIIPASFLQLSTERAFFAENAFCKYDPEFKKRCRQSNMNIVVAKENFGCGSSREQAVYALKENGVVCVIAESYPDIFYRNSLSNGLVLITVEDASGFVMGDALQVDLDSSTIQNVTKGESTYFEMKAEDRNTFQQGGMIGRVRRHLEEILLQQAEK